MRIRAKDISPSRQTYNTADINTMDNLPTDRMSTPSTFQLLRAPSGPHWLSRQRPFP